MSTNGVGVQGQSSNSMGVYGRSSASEGVYGLSTSAQGVYGQSTSSQGVYGLSTSSQGVVGQSTTGNGIAGVNNDATGAAAAITAISGSSSTGLAYWGAGNIYITGGSAEKSGGGTWSPTSDARVKKDVSDFENGLAELMRVRPVRFKYNGLGGTTDDGKEYVGVIAQELERVLPEMVATRMGKLHPTDSDQTAIRRVDPNEFTYLVINAVKEQQKILKEQERIIQQQNTRITALEQGRPPLSSSMMSLGGIESGLAIGLLPVGLVIVARRRRKHA